MGRVVGEVFEEVKDGFLREVVGEGCWGGCWGGCWVMLFRGVISEVGD